MVSPDVRRALRAASVGEVAWRRGPIVEVCGALPLLDARGPVLAFPWAKESTARSVAEAPAVLLTVTEPRGSGSAFRPLLLRCRSRLVEDRDGERFSRDLLEQELQRWPPSRVYADSPLLRREHWWWLPRLLVELEVVEVVPFAARGEPADHLLVVDTEAGLAAGVGLVERAGPGVTVSLRHGTPGPGEATLFGQDLSFPDLERWGQWAWHGAWDGAELRVRSAPDAPGLPPVPGVLARWRRERDLARACRRALER